MSLFVFWLGDTAHAKVPKPILSFTVSMPNPNNHQFSVELFCPGLQKDTIELKMPKWTPGYYQLMSYGKAVSNVGAKDVNGRAIAVKQLDENTWQIRGQKGKAFKLFYQVTATKQFVAESFLDSTHAYLIPGSLFVYVNGDLNTPVSIKIILPKQWKKSQRDWNLSLTRTMSFWRLTLINYTTRHC